MSDWLTAQMVEGQPKVRWPEGEARPADGKQVLVKVRSPRNIRHHRKYWGMLRALVDATGQWPSTAAAHRWVKIAVGHYVPHRQPDGTIFAELLPTDFAGMPQRQFDEFYALALAALAIETGIDPATLEKETRQ